MLAGALGSDDATVALHRTHTEIFHLVRLLGRMSDDLAGVDDDGEGEGGEHDLAPDDRTDLRRLLYGLDAILRLHMAQEEELYASIDVEVSQEATAPVTASTKAASRDGGSRPW